MPTHPTHNVNPVDDLAAQFKRLNQRISSLERASTSGGGGAGAAGPQGVRGRAVGLGSAWSNATATYTDITMNVGQSPSLTLSLDVTHLHRAVWYGPVTATVATDVFVFGMAVGAAATINSLMHFGAPNVANMAFYHQLFVPASGAPTVYKIQGRRSGSSTGTMSMVSQVTAICPSVFYIEDVGVIV